LCLFNVTSTVSEETCDEVQSLVFDLFANLGATGAFLVIQIGLPETFLFFVSDIVLFACYRRTVRFPSSLRIS
jgi:hypothetical protein